MQTLLFSATLPPWVKDITRRFLRKEQRLVDLVGTQKMKVSPQRAMHTNKTDRSVICILPYLLIQKRQLANADVVQTGFAASAIGVLQRPANRKGLTSVAMRLVSIAAHRM